MLSAVLLMVCYAVATAKELPTAMLSYWNQNLLIAEVRSQLIEKYEKLTYLKFMYNSYRNQ